MDTRPAREVEESKDIPPAIADEECAQLNNLGEASLSKSFLALRSEMVSALSDGYKLVVSPESHCFVPHTDTKSLWKIVPGSDIRSKVVSISLLDTATRSLREESATLHSRHAVMYLINGITAAAMRPGMIVTKLVTAPGDTRQCRDVSIPVGPAV